MQIQSIYAIDVEGSLQDTKEEETMTSRGALQLVQSKIRSALAKRLASERQAQQSGATTSSVHLIPSLQDEIETIFQEALAE